MKNLTNILSYLWLLLLMAVTACSDLEEEVGPMKGEEEVELTIRTQVPGMKVGTRAAETENLTTITALVFNAEKELIKKVDNIVTSATDGTQGTFTLKVPLRTRSIHFIGNPTGVNLPSVPSEGDAAVTHDALKTLTTTGSLAYWGYASFADVAALRAYKNQILTLYRNKAKISIEKAGSFDGSLAIAGLENVYKKGVLVPHNGDEFNFNLTNYDYQTLPTSVSNEEKGQEKYEPTVTETYVFEHPNDEGNALFVICLIDQKYYKVALAKNNSGTLSYYDIIRNHQYRIKINAINESLGQDSYDDAVNSDPINNAEAEVEETKDAVLTIESISASELVYNAGSKELSLTVNIPEGVSALTINASNFTASTTNGNLSSTGNNSFNVNSAGSVTFTLTLNNGVGSRGQQETISVVGTAKEGYRVTNPDSKTIILKEQVYLQTSLLDGVSSLMYSNEENSVSDLIVNVTIPAGVTTLEFSSDYFDVISANGRTKKETVDGEEVSTPYITGSGPYTVNHQGEGELTLPFRLRLKSEKKAPTSSAGYTFGGSGEGVTVTPATISNITLTESDDENVRWQGDVLLNWGNEGAVTQIPLPYSWFEGIAVDSKLRVDYEVTDAEKSDDNRDAVIQFTEVKGESWTDNSYFFEELRASENNDMGLNLSKLSATNIYSENYVELYLTQTILSQMYDNQTTFDGMENIVMAIQGGNVRLKKISVIPNNQADNGQLDIKLDFYKNENRDDNDFSNLVLGESKLTLEVTIPVEDSKTYAGTVQLKGAFSSSNPYANANGAIHWDNSRDKNSSTISYGSGDQNGTVLEFTIVEGQTSYKIDWVFTTGSHYPGYGDIAFTYTISNVDGKSYNIYGDTSATIEFTNEPVGIVFLNSQHQFETQDNGYWTSLTFDGPFPIGTKIILTFSEGGGIKLCDGSNNNLYVPAFASNNLYGNGGNRDLWMTAPTGNLVLDITEDIILYGKGTGTNNGNLSANNPLNRLIIESGATVLDKVVVVYPDGYVEEEEVIFNINFDNGSMENLSVVFHQDNGSQGTFDSTGGSLALNISSPGTDNWHAQITRAVSFEQNVTYKLTCKVKSTVSGNMVIWFDDPDNSHAVRVDNPPTVGLTVSNDFVNVEVYITPNQTDQTGRFVINFGLIPKGTIYIDDLKLVKN